MPVNQNRPYERHMVTNNPNLLAAGLTLADLAVGQIGIFDAKTNRSVTAPTYSANRGIYFAQGTPDRGSFPEGAMVPNIYRKSHVIQGKSLISLRGARASRGRGEIVTLGFDGSDTSKTLSGKPGDTFYYWIRLTGEPIYNLNPDRGKGVIIQGAVSLPCPDDCSDNCTSVDPSLIADLVLNDIVGIPDINDPLKIKGGKFLPGGARVTDYVHFSKTVNEAQPVVSSCFHYCTIAVLDNGTQSDLGLLQAAFPGVTISVKGREGIVTTYQALTADGTECPADYVQGPTKIVAICDTCPTSGTFVPETFTYTVLIPANGPDDQSADITAALTAYDNVETVLLQIDPLTGTATYQVSTTTTGDQSAGIQVVILASVGKAGTSVTVAGSSVATCILPGQTYGWEADTCDAFCQYLGTYTITLKDKVCGPCESGSVSADSDSTYFSEIEALYIDSGFAANLTVSAAGANCTRKYTIDVVSNLGQVGCTKDAIVFPLVPSFNEQEWTFVSVVTTGDPVTATAAGIQAASDFIGRDENECTFGYFVKQYDWVHIEMSSHNPDWRSTDLCETDPVATRIQNGAYPNGDGSYVVRIEKADRMYDMDYWYLAPNLREGFDFYFEARFDTYYDMVAVEYEFNYSSNDGFGQTDHDRYVQFFWLPESNTGQLTTALNTYAASANINIEPVVV